MKLKKEDYEAISWMILESLWPEQDRRIESLDSIEYEMYKFHFDIQVDLELNK